MGLAVGEPDPGSAELAQHAGAVRDHDEACAVGKVPEGDEVAIEHAGWSEPVKSTVDLFNQVATMDQRQRRVIATGNLLKAFTTIQRHGQIVNFRTHDGQIQPGILYREKIRNLSDAVSGRSVPMTADDAARQVRETEGQPLTSEDGNIAITNSGRGYVMVAIAKAKDKGGKYFLNPQVISAIGKDFYSRGNVMRADIAPAKVPALIQALTAVGARFMRSASLDPDKIETFDDPPVQASATKAPPQLTV